MMKNKYLMNKKLNRYFENRIKFSLVTPQNTLIVTKDDKVYEFDQYSEDHKNSLIALSVEESDIEKFIEIFIKEELCGKSIKKFEITIERMYALTEDGDIYSWVQSKNWQLYHSKISEETQYKPQLIQYFKDNDIKVKDICCGVSHILALTTDNLVYGWGSINGETKIAQIGDVSNTKDVKVSEPHHFDSFGLRKVILISCGASHSLTLTECGTVFSWGSNITGQCGLRGQQFYASPQEVIIIEENKRVLIKSIRCNREQSLLLSTEGDIYVFGRNYEGELGTGVSGHHFEPRKIIGIKKIESIATSYYNLVLMVKSVENTFYFWGDFQRTELERIITEPRESFEFTSFNDIYHKYFGYDFEMNNKLMIDFEDNFMQNGFCRKWFIDEKYIGGGGYGKCFRVRYRDNISDYFVIKKIPMEENFEKDFLNEWELFTTLKNIQSNRIVHYFDAWLENEYKFNKRGEKEFKKNVILHIRMELCDKTLRDLIREMDEDLNLVNTETKKLTLLGYYIASQIFIDVLKGVSVLHTNNPQFIHRDLKPENIFVKMDDKSDVVVKIGDLGLVTLHKYFGQTHSAQRGPPNYTAPEVYQGLTDHESKAVYDTRADIYLLGWVLMELFRLDKKSLDSDQLIEKLDDLLLKAKYLSLINILRKMMETDPYRRIDNLSQIIDEHDSWALNSDEFDINEALSEVLKSGPIDKSYVYQMCRKYFLNSFEDKFIRNNWYKTEYEEQEYLGEGKFGQVFKVRNIWNNNLFAIKKIKLLKEISIEALKRDIKFITSNEYENDMIVQYLEFWIENDCMNTTTLFIRMELCDMSLSEFNKELEKYPELEDTSLTPMGYFLASQISLDLITNIIYLLSFKKLNAYFTFSPKNVLLKIDENSFNLVRLSDVGIKMIHKYAQRLSLNRKNVNISEYLAKRLPKSSSDEETYGGFGPTSNFVENPANFVKKCLTSIQK